MRTRTRRSINWLIAGTTRCGSTRFRICSPSIRTGSGQSIPTGRMATGAPGEVDISRVGENLVARCRARGVVAGLSTSYKHDADNVRMRIRTIEDYAQLWLATLRITEAAGLLDAILYVDLRNEFSNAKWVPISTALTRPNRTL
jgi:hypothetical protein